MDTKKAKKAVKMAEMAMDLMDLEDEMAADQEADLQPKMDILIHWEESELFLQQHIL